jgi:hypothetical protein
MLGGAKLPTRVVSSAASRDWMRNPRKDPLEIGTRVTVRHKSNIIIQEWYWLRI